MEFVTREEIDELERVHLTACEKYEKAQQRHNTATNPVIRVITGAAVTVRRWRAVDTGEHFAVATENFEYQPPTNPHS